MTTNRATLKRSDLQCATHVTLSYSHRVLRARGNQPAQGGKGGTGWHSYLWKTRAANIRNAVTTQSQPGGSNRMTNIYLAGQGALG